MTGGVMFYPPRCFFISWNQGMDFGGVWRKMCKFTRNPKNKGAYFYVFVDKLSYSLFNRESDRM